MVAGRPDGEVCGRLGGRMAGLTAGWTSGRLLVRRMVGSACGQLGGRPSGSAGDYIAGRLACHPAAGCSRPDGRAAGRRARRAVKGAFRVGGLLYESPGGNQVDGLPPVPNTESHLG